jgi:hypothetical protein
MVMPNFVKVGPLAPELKGGTHIQTALWLHKHTYLPFNEGKKAKKISVFIREYIFLYDESI